MSIDDGKVKPDEVGELELADIQTDNRGKDVVDELLKYR